MKNRKGFTLIELLAVIIILGILMIIAIPSVTRYISDSRKNAYVDTAKEIISGARNLVNEGKLEMYDTDVTYYIESSCIKTENASKSPYGEFTKAYVVVTYDGKGYTYYWTSVDDAGQGIKNIVRIDKLDTDNVESDLKDIDISNTLGIGGRHKYIIIDENTGCSKGVSNNVTGFLEDILITFPEGKNRFTTSIGDTIKIGTEKFYLIKKDNETGEMTLISYYNLNVGDNKIENEPEGIQNENVLGYSGGYTTYGNVAFSDVKYWKDNIGDNKIYVGQYCSTISGIDNCVNVFDENSNLYPYIMNYKSYLEKEGLVIKEARLLKTSDINYDQYGQIVSIIRETSFCLSTMYSENYVWCLYANASIGNAKYNDSSRFGVRPVIVI